MKYNTEIDFNSNDSHAKIIHQISPKTTVLEFGCANGQMTKYMKEVLECRVYIVEMDKQSFDQAMPFASQGICCDISSLEWKKWNDIKFDYILFADVLEHLVNPEVILLEITEMLKEDGHVILSIPNITHNDIIVKLCEDRFDYTPLGLLDNTHIHFWGKKNIVDCVNNLGYKIENMDFTIWKTGQTEQALTPLSDLDSELISILSNRKYGQVYQFILTLTKRKAEPEFTEAPISNDVIGKIYFAEADKDFSDDFSMPISAYYIDYKEYQYKQQITIPSDVHKILIKPCQEHKCILYNLELNLKVKHYIEFSTSIKHEDKICFIDNNPFIIITLQENSINNILTFKANIILDGYKYTEIMCDEVKNIMNNYTENYEKIQSELEALTQKLEQINQSIKEKDNQIVSKLDYNNKEIEKIRSEMSSSINKTNILEHKLRNLDIKLSTLLNVSNKISWKEDIFARLHHVNNDIYDIASSKYFDGEWYIKQYQINAKNNFDAARHYLEQGWKYYYDPSIYFSSVAYLISNWDVKDAGINPLLHYEREGKKEHRELGPIENIQYEYQLLEKSLYFIESWYREKYALPDEMDAIYHFLFEGAPQLFNPSDNFSTIDYLMDNMWLMGNTQNPLVHYEINKNNPKIKVKKVNLTPVKYDFANCPIINTKAKGNIPSQNNNTIDSHKESVDIIICVYNAFEDVRKCINSVLQFTNHPYHIIIVDDNSAELTASYLRELASDNKDITLIVNTSDMHGYTYAANIGLKNSHADYCIMLNSDTIVSAHWVDNMIACAKSNDKIGVVGPLSNTASWQSVPKLVDEDGDWCHNDLPLDYTIEQTAKIIEENSGKIFPKVPLLNGFCLMICRKVIDTIGFFDEENFGRGFAEEDDYNTRAIKAGFKLAIADNTYVYHSQSKSYTDEKRLQLCKLSGEALRKKHGQEYIDNCSKYMATNDVLDAIRKKVSVLFEKENLIKECKSKYAGKKILILLPSGNASGGANVIIQEGLALIKMGVDITFLNLLSNQNNYNETYGNLSVPVIWKESYSQFDMQLASKYDAVICTLFRTVEYCKFLAKIDSPKLAYYIQDYEPYFIQEELLGDDYDQDEYKKAVCSYTLIPRCINVTKTEWNRNEVYKNTGADCKVIGPSVNTSLFMPRFDKHIAPLVISAMIRPSTKRRGPQMTYDILRALKLEFGESISIRIFGADPDTDLNSKLFFAKQKQDFEYINYGLTSPWETSMILAESNIFLDLSEFQAMGLTAMEAMACGCATVVPVHGGTSSFAKDRKNCLVIDTLDYKECLQAGRNLIIDKQLRESLRKQAYLDMIEFYPEKSAEKLLNSIFNS